ncbi:MAG TPA: hypothetical protein DCQ04_02130 [Actinobacteria bacterium]|nr:hypothetical protein [Actinomycetota bacterium]
MRQTCDYRSTSRPDQNDSATKDDFLDPAQKVAARHLLAFLRYSPHGAGPKKSQGSSRTKDLATRLLDHFVCCAAADRYAAPRPSQRSICLATSRTAPTARSVLAQRVIEFGNARLPHHRFSLHGVSDDHLQRNPW